MNSTRAVILGLLHEGAATGGQIVAAAERRLAAQGGVTRSQVYREIPVLLTQGYIEATEGNGGKQHSHAYQITGSGRERFAAWAADPIRNDLVRSATVLRLGFGSHLDADQRRRIVDTARADHLLALVEHEQCAKELRASGDHFAASAAAFAVQYEHAFLAWLDTVPIS
jgi:DNA-binding PadR family transcriptional regulator